MVSSKDTSIVFKMVEIHFSSPEMSSGVLKRYMYSYADLTLS